MPEQAYSIAYRRAIGHQIAPEHGGGATLHRQQTRAQAQQRCLAGAVGATQQHDLTALHGERGTGQRRKAAQHRDHVDQRDGRVNGISHGGLNGRLHSAAER